MNEHNDEICKNVMCSKPDCLIKKQEKYKKELSEIKKINWQLKQFERHISKINERKKKITVYLQNKGVFVWA